MPPAPLSPSDRMPSPATPSDDGALSSTVRSVLSLLLVLHFACVFTVLASTYLRSELQVRLVNIFGPYTQLLGFDPGNAIPYFYTHGRTQDDDAVIQVDLYTSSDIPVAQQETAAQLSLPADESPWLGNRAKAIGLARLLAVIGDPDRDDDSANLIARGVGRRAMNATGTKKAVVRCVRRLTQPLDLRSLLEGFPPNDPTAAEYDELIFEADVWIDEDGDVQVQRRAAAAEVAPRRTSTTAPRPANATP
jgi:hypothetical protein